MHKLRCLPTVADAATIEVFFLIGAQMSASSNQSWDPEQYSEKARFVSDLGMPVVELLAPRPGERILDLGCGDGPLTSKLADLGCWVVGVDASPEMIAAARALGLEAHVMDGHALQFDSEFDAVFSNAALHWMTQPGKVIAGVWRALKPGGRFVGECGGQGNVATIAVALESALARRGIDASAANPWYFAGTEEYRSLLEQHGFKINSIALIARPTPLPGHIVGWLETFAKSFTVGLPVPDRQAFLEEVAESCRARLCDANGNWTADYVRLRFSATKPAAAA
jgi:trans-aconitate methyltransferase